MGGKTVMKATGIVRKVDELGRVVIPIELRRTLGVDVRDPLEIFVNGDQIILQKYAPDTEKEYVIGKLGQIQAKAKQEDKEILELAIKLIK